MPKTKRKTSARALPFAGPLPQRQNVEFSIEGDLWIRFSESGVPMFVLDDCHLSEFVRRHFSVQHHEDGDRIGKVKILIIPINE